MPCAVSNLSLLLDAIPGKKEWRYTAALFERRPEEGWKLAEEVQTPFHEMVARASPQPSPPEGLGAALFDWAFPPGSRQREVFLLSCTEAARQGGGLRLWLCLGPGLARYDCFQFFERHARVSLEGFWVREWAEDAARPDGAQNPFLALNPWVRLVRRPPRVSVARRFTVPGKVNVLIVVSNPPPPGSGRWPHIKHLEPMLRRVHRPFRAHRSVGWVFPLRNPSKVAIARCIRDYRPHVVIYLGHGYFDLYGSGLVLPLVDEGMEFEGISGVRKLEGLDSELEQMLAGKWQALTDPGANDEGLPAFLQDRTYLYRARAFPGLFDDSCGTCVPRIGALSVTL